MNEKDLEYGRQIWSETIRDLGLALAIYAVLLGAYWFVVE